MPGLMDALIQQESSGRRGIQGPMTKWGRAQGLAQVLPATGAEMAQKLGVPWRPDLMTARTDEGAAYQRRIGEAYLQEGLQKTGNTRDALRYYHGGPDRRQWGPKTNAYADQVMALAGNEQPMPISQMPAHPMPMPQEMLNQPAQMQPQPQILGQDMSLSGMMKMDPASLQQPQAPAAKPKAFDPGGKGWVIAGIIADAIAGGFGGRGGFAPAYAANQEQNREAELYREKVAAEREERMRPQAQSLGGGSFGMVDPQTGQVTPTYQPEPHAPEPTDIERKVEFLRRVKPDITDEEIAEIVQQGIAPERQSRIVTYAHGNETVTAEIGPDGERTEISRAPRWQPDKPSRGVAKLPPGFILD